MGEEVKEEEAWKINFFPMTRLQVMWEHFLIRRKVIINHHSLSRAHVMSLQIMDNTRQGQHLVGLGRGVIINNSQNDPRKQVGGRYLK